MMLKLTSDNGSQFLVNSDKLIRIRFRNGETIIVYSDEDYESVKETPEEIMKQIERIRISELAIERIFRNPQYNPDTLIDFGFILQDVQRFKHHNNL